MSIVNPRDAVVDITLPVDKNGNFCPVAGVRINGMLLDGGFELDLTLCNGVAPRFSFGPCRDGGFRLLPSQAVVEGEA